MGTLKLILDTETLDLIDAAAGYEKLPRAAWARVVLLKEARSIAHKMRCEKPKDEAPAKPYKWAGRPCTREEYEAGKALEEKTRAGLGRRA